MDLNSTSQVSTLVREPAPSPTAKAAPAVDAPAPAAGSPVDQTQASTPPQPAAKAPAPWVDRTPTEPLVDRSFPLSDRAARLNLTI